MPDLRMDVTEQSFKIKAKTPSSKECLKSGKVESYNRAQLIKEFTRQITKANIDSTPLKVKIS